MLSSESRKKLTSQAGLRFQGFKALPIGSKFSIVVLTLLALLAIFAPLITASAGEGERAEELAREVEPGEHDDARGEAEQQRDRRRQRCAQRGGVGRRIRRRCGVSHRIRVAPGRSTRLEPLRPA